MFIWKRSTRASLRIDRGRLLNRISRSLTMDTITVSDTVRRCRRLTTCSETTPRSSARPRKGPASMTVKMSSSVRRISCGAVCVVNKEYFSTKALLVCAARTLPPQIKAAITTPVMPTTAQPRELINAPCCPCGDAAPCGSPSRTRRCSIIASMR